MPRPSHRPPHSSLANPAAPGARGWTIRRPLGATLIALALTAALVGSALADAAPPQYGPGAAVGPGGFATNVQMAREDVLVTVTDAITPTRPDGHLASDAISGHVTATFLMRNLGTTAEAFDVWFPLRREYEEAIGEGFTARVNGVPAPVRTQVVPGDPSSSVETEEWATWPARFPPGEDVVLEVAYDMRPTGYMPYGTFGYSLDTGAGWRGPIGAGTVTFRLPYDVNSDNAALNADSMWDTGIRPAGFTVSGRDVIWRFHDLEPTEADNIRLTVLTPRLWRALEPARAAAKAKPDSAAAQADLGRALSAALYYNKDMGVVEVADSVALAREAEAAFQRAVRLAPDDVGILLDYLDYLYHAYAFYVYGDAPAAFREGVERAIALAPESERLADYRFLRDEFATAAPTLTASVALQSTRDAQTKNAWATVQALDTRVHGTTPARTTVVPTARATAPPAATPRPEGGATGHGTGRGLGILAALAVLVAAAAGIVLWRRRGRD